MGNIAPEMRVEVQHAFWLPLEDGPTRLSYKGEREVVARALEYRQVPIRSWRTMPQTPHIERHFTAGEVVRDVVIGMSDGLTVPFALAAGLSGAVDNSRIVVVAGLAEIAAGSIAMGLGGYLAARSDAEHYASERQREEREVQEIPDEEAREVQKVFADYGLSPEESVPVIQALTKKPKEWVDFMMRFELGLEEPDPKRAVQSAAHHRRVLHRRRHHPAGAVHVHAQLTRRLGVVGGGHACSPWASLATSKADSPARGQFGPRRKPL